MDDKKINLAAAGVNLVKSVMAVGIMIFILTQHTIFDKFEATGDTVFVTVGKGMRVMLVAFLVMCVAGLIQSVIEFVILLKGDQETDFGERFLRISVTIRECAGLVIQLVMGVIFAAAGFFVMFGIEEAKSNNGFIIVGAVFAIAGIGCAIGAVIGLVKAVKRNLGAM